MIFYKPLLLLSFVSLCLFLSSCSHGPSSLSFNSNNDFLSKESYARFDLNSLESSKGYSNYILQCKKGDGKKVIANFFSNETFKKDPFWYWNTIALCYFYSDENLKSKFYFQTAFINAKKNKKLEAIVENNSGVIELKEKRTYLALNHFIKALELNPNMLSAKFNIINIYLPYGISSPVKKILNDLISLSAKDPDLIHAKASVLLIEKQYGQAKTQYEQMNKSDLAFKEFLSHYYASGILSSNKNFKPLSDIPDPISSESALVNVNFDKINNYLNNLKAKE